MKREDLKKLLGESATDETIDKIMSMHGADIETHKTKLTEAETARDQFKTQLGEANTAIEGFKKLDVTAIQAAADDYKAKYEQAQKDSTDALAKVKFDHALEGALTGAKAKNPKAVRALLEMQNLKLNEADGSIIGLEDQLKSVKEKNDYLFDSETPAPRIVTGGNNQSIGNMSALESAARRGGGFKTGTEIQGK